MPTKKTSSKKRTGPKTKASKKLAKSPRARSKVHKVMKEHKEGKLRSGSGKKVTSRKQAIAIALSEAGASNKTKKRSQKR